MKLLNGSEVIAKHYREEDAEEIVNLIIRNFKEVNYRNCRLYYSRRILSEKGI